MTWWQILLLVIGVIWTAGAVAMATLGFALSGSYGGSPRTSVGDYFLIAILLGIGPGLIALAVVT